MAKKQKLNVSNKLKEGVSVEEMHYFFRKYMAESFIILSIIVATISSIFDFFIAPGWSLFFGALGASLSIGLPEKVHVWLKKWFSFVYSQDRTAQVIIGCIRLAIALFIPLVIFVEIGLLCGVAFHDIMKEIGFSSEEETLEEFGEEHEDEHV